MKSFEYTLTHEMRDKIALFVETLAHNPYETPEQSRAYLANYIRSLLPENLKQSLQDMRVGTLPLLVLHNLPMDSHIPTGKPVSERLKEKGYVSEHTLLAFSQLFGTSIIANPKEQNGALIHNVSPVSGMEQTRSSLGVEPLLLHTESPQEKNPPHYMMLLCLEGDPKASTMFFHLDKLNEKLGAEVIASLKKPIYEIHSGASYTDSAIKTVQPILEVDDITGKTTMHYIRDNTRVFPVNGNEEAAHALRVLNGVLEKAEKDDVIKINLREKGDAIIFNNGWGIGQVGGMMHGRGDKIENPYRWLQRGLCYMQTEEQQNRTAETLASNLEASLNKESTIPFNVAAATLRESMLQSNGVNGYKQAHPEVSDKQAVLYGLETRNTAQSWVQRVAQESVTNKRPAIV